MHLCLADMQHFGVVYVSFVYELHGSHHNDAQWPGVRVVPEIRYVPENALPKQGLRHEYYVVNPWQLLRTVVEHCLSVHLVSEVTNQVFEFVLCYPVVVHLCVYCFVSLNLM